MPSGYAFSSFILLSFAFLGYLQQKFKSVFNACIFIDLFYDDFRNKKNEFSTIFPQQQGEQEEKEEERMIIIIKNKIKMAQLICEHLPTI